VLGGELVSKSIRRAAEDRGVAEGVQRTTAAQQFGLFDAEGICYIDEAAEADSAWLAPPSSAANPEVQTVV
jgi:hypothetical protein